MIKKIKENKNFYLLGLSVFLFLGAFIVNDPFSWFSHSIKKSESLLQMNFESIDSIEVVHNGQQVYSLFNKDGNWYVTKDSQKYLSDAAIVRSTFEPLFQLNRFHLIGKGKKLIEKFSLNDSGWKVHLKNSQATTDIFFAQGENANTLVRLSKEDSIFGADSYLLTSLKNDVNYFRNKKIVRLEKENLSSIEIQRKNIAYRLEANEENNTQQWYIVYKGRHKTSNIFLPALQNFLNAQADGFLIAQEAQALPSYAKLILITKSQNKLILDIRGRKDSYYAVNVQRGINEATSEWLQVPYYVVENFLQPDTITPENWIAPKKQESKEEKK